MSYILSKAERLTTKSCWRPTCRAGEFGGRGDRGTGPCEERGRIEGKPKHVAYTEACIE